MTSNQTLFNDAFIGLRDQGFELSSNKDNCWYRHPNENLKCAIGHCIPDDLYNPRMDDTDDDATTGVQHNQRVQRVLEQIYPGYNLNFAISLQEAHDSSRSSKDMESRLRALATKHNMEVPA